jgi:predicted RNase H-like nuclease (RuvC/YqgF family)
MSSTEVNAVIEISKKDLEIAELKKKLEEKDQRIQKFNKDIEEWKETMILMMKTIINKF